MKKYLIILGFIFFSFGSISAFALYYDNGIPTTTLEKRVITRPIYNPYGNYGYNNNYYRYRNYQNNLNRIRKINQINRIRNNIRRNYYNFLTLNNNGTLTGYSTPINSYDYEKLIKENDNFKNEYNQKTNLKEIFKMPSNRGMYYQNGEWINRGGDISGSAGVKIIYD